MYYEVSNTTIIKDIILDLIKNAKKSEIEEQKERDNELDFNRIVELMIKYKSNIITVNENEKNCIKN